MNATIRSAKPGDERTLAELNAVVQQLHVDGGPAGRFKPPNAAETAAWFRAKLESETSWVWLGWASRVS